MAVGSCAFAGPRHRRALAGAGCVWAVIEGSAAKPTTWSASAAVTGFHSGVFIVTITGR